MPGIDLNLPGSHSSSTSRSTAAGRSDVLFYVIKKPHGGYVVWETTPSKIFELSSQDPTLAGRLDRSPFATRAEADQRLQALNASSPVRGGGAPQMPAGGLAGRAKILDKSRG